MRPGLQCLVSRRYSQNGSTRGHW